MGRRSRKRIPAGASRAERAAMPRAVERPAAAAPRRAAKRERPPAPWGAFPLVELCVLVAIVIGVLGIVTGGRHGAIMLGCAAALGSLAGLELSIREHFAGFKSHSTALAGAVAVAVAALLFFVVHPPRGIALAAAVAVFLVGLRAFQMVFRRRSGGLSFR